MIIWSNEILEALKYADPKEKVCAKIGDDFYPIFGIEDSQSVGWWEIRFNPDIGLPRSANVEELLRELPEDFMVMLQERGHLGKSYPITNIFPSFRGGTYYWILKCDNTDLEYWEELEKWKIEEDKKLINT